MGFLFEASLETRIGSIVRKIILFNTYGCSRISVDDFFEWWYVVDSEKSKLSFLKASRTPPTLAYELWINTGKSKIIFFGFIIIFGYCTYIVQSITCHSFSSICTKCMKRRHNLCVFVPDNDSINRIDYPLFHIYDSPPKHIVMLFHLSVFMFFESIAVVNLDSSQTLSNALVFDSVNC